jgi:crotonobetainyl-CoA:carnitine CoA-transferase CaiB-like acyl-CoA transferase
VPEPGRRPGPLGDIVVCDFTVALSGPTATYGLAQLGATVIKIEKTENPERNVKFLMGGADATLDFASTNGGKKSISVDLRSPEGAELIRRLIARSDVVVENFGHGAMERLGLGYDDVRTFAPHVIYASVKGFNPESPWANFLAYDPVCQAAAGASSLTGHPDGRPIRPVVPASDTGAGSGLLAGVMAAILQRDVTGEGQAVFISMFDAVIHFLRPHIAEYLATGVVPSRNGNLHPSPLQLGYCEAIPCRGGGANDYCVVEINNDDQWRALLSVTGLGKLAEVPEFRSVEARHRHAPDVTSALSAWFSERTKQQAMEELLRGGIRAAAVMTPFDIMQAPNLWGDDTFEELKLPDGSVVKALAHPMKFGAFRYPIDTGPAWGEHTREVLTGLLGYSEQEVKTLLERGVVGEGEGAGA